MTKAILQHSTSRSLIAGLRVRDIKSWAVLGELYGPVVLSWCRRTGLDDADAHDVAQEVILRVMERIGNFHRRSDSDRFRNWLKTICKNEVIRFCEKKQRVRCLPVEQIEQLLRPADSQEESDSLHRREQQRLVERATIIALRNVRPRTRDIFLAHVYSHRSAADVACEYGVSAGNVRKIVSIYCARISDLIHMTNLSEGISDDV